MARPSQTKTQSANKHNRNKKQSSSSSSSSTSSSTTVKHAGVSKSAWTGAGRRLGGSSSSSSTVAKTSALPSPFAGVAAAGAGASASIRAATAAVAASRTRRQTNMANEELASRLDDTLELLQSSLTNGAATRTRVLAQIEHDQQQRQAAAMDQGMYMSDDVPSHEPVAPVNSAPAVPRTQQEIQATLRELGSTATTAQKRI
ncbi:hypothetical protein CAOG_002498 [Capsaspora owczarzaki ATCC 30864]|uniref:Uncharacterized protein n=2 Tax=Capsaspora owczarzaki (strain ATCC 30864) TaxID=595528 RepID=A0A0D2X1T2_CAPO3|nr:hypothetical protein CAOG_002498 [Capsaspora owczarzaki ATCC 30864]